jgi:hypothetical protein
VSSALGFRVGAGTVRVWAARGRIAIRGYEPALREDAEARPMYRVGDVIDRVREAA